LVRDLEQRAVLVLVTKSRSHDMSLARRKINGTIECSCHLICKKAFRSCF
jgi:hypothetical protein